VVGRVKALHVLLLEDCMMLLQKQGDKYQLKFHAAGAGNAAGEKAPTSDKRLFHSPIIKFNTMLVRPVATDKRAFYLLNTTDRGPQIYELLANGAGEREKWIKYITEASTAYKSGMPKAKSEPEALAAKAVDGTRRPASFRDKTSSPRLERPDRQNSSPPEGLNIPRKEDEEDNAPTTPKKRLQRVEILKIVDSTPMIEPSQVHVNTPTVLVADPVVTPFEKLRQKDEEVSRILDEKQRLISEILDIHEDEFDTIADMAATSGTHTRDAKEILLAALAQAKSLTSFVNSSLQVTEAELVTSREPGAGAGGQQLVQITTSMNQHLTDLLAILQERDLERDVLRRELAKCQDQIKGFFRSDSTRSFPSQVSSTTLSTVSRPNSFISLESDTGDCEAEAESEPGEARPHSLLSFSSDNCAADTDTEDTSPQTSPVSRTVPVNGLHGSPLVPEVPPTECGPPGPASPASSDSEEIIVTRHDQLQHGKSLEPAASLVVEEDPRRFCLRNSLQKEWTPDHEDDLKVV